MQNEIYRGKYYLVETNAGTELVPETCVPVPMAEVPERIELERDEEYAAEYDALCTDLLAFCEGEEIYLIEVDEGYYGRRSMPGYLDRTDWHWADTAESLIADLAEMYGDIE